MSRTLRASGTRNERPFLLALAACCAGPMLAIVGFTSVFGMTIGPASALTLGLVAALACVALMIRRHRHDPHHRPPTGDPT